MAEERNEHDEMRRRTMTLDWALKRILRGKASATTLQGFLGALLKEDVEVLGLLDGESEREHADDKSNRVDLKVRLTDGRLIIVEVQAQRQYDFLARMLFGTAKVVTDHMGRGDRYEDVSRVVSVNVVFFDLGIGKDYAYHGTTTFVGMRCNDVLELSERQRSTFGVEHVHQIFPEYYILKVNQFDQVARDPLDQWIHFFKTGTAEDGFDAPGLQDAVREFDLITLDENERREYEAYLSELRDVTSTVRSARLDGREEGIAIGHKEGLAVGRSERNIDIARNLLATLDDVSIAAATGLTVAEVAQLRAEGRSCGDELNQ